jgi:hypothetical protein
MADFKAEVSSMKDGLCFSFQFWIILDVLHNANCLKVYRGISGL